MKSARFLCLAVLVIGFAAVGRADGLPVDPVLDVSDPTCSEGCTSVGPDLTFHFFSDGAGGGINFFQNNSGQSWSSLLIETGSSPFNVPANTVTCTTNAFLMCQVFDLAGGVTAMYLSGVASEVITGIGNGVFFTIELNDIKGIDGGSWGNFRRFDATANAASPVPEPATLTLLGIGIGALAAKRRFRGERNSRA
jgi:PEP-CTERM motif